MLQGNSDRYESMTFLFSFVICSADVMLSPCTVWFAHHEPFPWLKICSILLLISGVNFPSLPFPPCCGFPQNICQGTMGIRYWIGWDGLWTDQGVFFLNSPNLVINLLCQCGGRGNLQGIINSCISMWGCV